MKFVIEYSEEKNELLKKTRGICFEDVIDAMSANGILADLVHPSKKRYANQNIYVVKIDNYAYIVPYVRNTKNNSIFLKTVYPSRVYTKKFIKTYEK